MRGALFQAFAGTIGVVPRGPIASVRFKDVTYPGQGVVYVSDTAARLNALLRSASDVDFAPAHLRSAVQSTRNAYTAQLKTIFGGMTPAQVIEAGKLGKVVSFPLVAALFDAALAHAEAVDDALSAPTKTEAFQQELGKTAADFGRGVGGAGKGFFEGFTGVPVWLALAVVLLVVAHKTE